jgi:hypothetical protein
MEILFQQLPIVYMKHKMIHKDFFRLIKAYINFGKEFILTEKQRIDSEWSSLPHSIASDHQGDVE